MSQHGRFLCSWLRMLLYSETADIDHVHVGTATAVNREGRIHVSVSTFATEA
jgi:hypothetical protein